ncbi:MAG: cytochrome-c peroxidase [Gammaproteobacteria bacterium]|nr:cytochrome-c peroxidase [Gammaproteobacteria bacterium]MDH5777076.1 cytochrome-c peroxidase [Gammaproteobacteria bacterium]
MRKRVLTTFSGIVIFLCTGIVFTQANDAVAWNEAERASISRLSIHALGESPELKVNRVAKDAKAAELGHHLFFDTRLSINGKVACASCHLPEKYFTDGRKTAKGINSVNRNAPTVVGINHSNWLFLDGRTDSLWSQAMQPLENEHEHGTNRSHVVHVVYKDKKLHQLYEASFGAMPDLLNKARFPEQAGPVKDRAASYAWQNMKKSDQEIITGIFVNLAKAIAAYELKLNPSPARFDHFAQALEKNEAKAAEILNKQERAGLKLFLNKGKCNICHNGPMFSDFSFHNIATPQLNAKKYDWGRYKGVNKLLRSKFNCRSQYNDDPEKNCDEIKYIIRKREHTIGLFRTPSLRNITKTAPYMHAGQYKTLKEVIDHYVDPPKTLVGTSDLIPFPIDLTKQEKQQLEAFLGTLDSDIDAAQKWLTSPH